MARAVGAGVLDLELTDAPDVREKHAYLYGKLVLEREVELFMSGGSALRLLEFWRYCRSTAEDLSRSAEALGYVREADHWREEAATYNEELRKEEEILSRRPTDPGEPQRVMKALRFSPSLYAEAKKFAADLNCTLTSFIEEAIREKLVRMRNDPELAAELDRRRAFDKARARKLHLLRGPNP